MATLPTTRPPRSFRAGKSANSSTAPARKKACTACSVAKVRCDLTKPRCSRCEARSLQCQYAQTANDYQGETYWHTTSATGTDYPVTTTGSQVESTTVLPGFNETSAFDSCGAASSVPQTVPAQYQPTTETETYQTSGNDVRTLNPTDLTVGDADSGPLAPSASAARLETHTGQYSASHTSSDVGKDPKTSSGIDLAAPVLVCTVDASRVRDRWFREFEPPADQQPKVYTPGVLHFVSRVMGSFPRMMATGDINSLPPIIHPAQMRTSPVPTVLVNSITLTRMWQTRVPGGEAIVRTTIVTEMERILKERRSYDQLNLLAAFQAYLLYTIMLFFPVYNPSHKEVTPDSSVDEPSQIATRMTMINLQEIAHDLTLTGLICPEELHGQESTPYNGMAYIPDLSSWILAATKRRTLVTMYILDSTYCNMTNLLWFNADEIGNLPAPASKSLWNASIQCSSGDVNISEGESKWRREYKRYLSQWEGSDGRTALLRIEEFWPDKFKTGFDRGREREKRVGQWIGDLDEFGMMFLAVTGVTHFC